MKTPFRLDEHPRRPQPLAPPPDHYFDRLPLRVMQRVQPAAEAPRYGWLTTLPLPLRTVLASSVVLSAFVGSFLLSESTPTPNAPMESNALAAVPHTEMVEYLLASEQRLSLTDLAELPAVERVLPETYLKASPDELQEVLDAQPADDTYL